MATDQNTKSASRKRTILAVSLLALSVCGILFLTWKDIYSPIPAFTQLQQAQANGFRADIAREVWGPHEYSIEFYDGAGKRFQTRGVSKPALDQIKSALSGEIPVSIRYGKWQSVFPSKTIFSVYQIEVSNRVVIPYSQLADARQREQAGGPLIILSTIIAAGIAVFIALRRERRFRQQLELLNAQKR